jgi:hypothetical protein
MSDAALIAKITAAVLAAMEAEENEVPEEAPKKSRRSRKPSAAQTVVVGATFEYKTSPRNGGTSRVKRYRVMAGKPGSWSVSKLDRDGNPAGAIREDWNVEANLAKPAGSKGSAKLV